MRVKVDLFVLLMSSPSLTGCCLTVFLDPYLFLLAMAFEGVWMGFGPVESSVSSPGVRCMGFLSALAWSWAGSCLDLHVPVISGDVGWKQQVWPLMPGLLNGKVWRASCLVLVGASFQCPPAVYWGLLNLSIDSCCPSVLPHLLNSVVQCNYLLEKNSIISWNLIFLQFFKEIIWFALGRVTSDPLYLEGTVISARSFLACG